MAFQYFSKNGEILPYSQAMVPLDDIAYQYGFGVYETLRVRGGVLYFVKQHVDRLLSSARLIGLDHNLRPKSVVTYIEELVVKNNIENSNIKVILVGGEESTLYILPLSPLFPDKKMFTRGVTTKTVVYERFLPNAKTLNMIRSYMYFTNAYKQGHYDVLFLDKKSNILEGSRTNFFVIKGNILITAFKEKVLEGVTKQTLVAVAKNNGFKVRESDIPVSKLSEYDGAFFTSTVSKIIPIVQVDDFKFLGISPKVKELMKLYDEFLDKSGGVFEL